MTQINKIFVKKQRIFIMFNTLPFLHMLENIALSLHKEFNDHEVLVFIHPIIETFIKKISKNFNMYKRGNVFDFQNIINLSNKKSGIKFNLLKMSDTKITLSLNINETSMFKLKVKQSIMPELYLKISTKCLLGANWICKKKKFTPRPKKIQITKK